MPPPTPPSAVKLTPPQPGTAGEGGDRLCGWRVQHRHAVGGRVHRQPPSGEKASDSSPGLKAVNRVSVPRRLPGANALDQFLENVGLVAIVVLDAVITFWGRPISWRFLV